MTREEKIKAIIADTDKNYAPYYDVLPNLIKERGYKSGVEIGVFCGGHAERLINSNIEHLFGIDPYQMYEPGMPLLNSQEDWDTLYEFVIKRLSQKPGIYIHFLMDSNEALESIEWTYSSFDFIFIDGLHTYDQLKQDLENYEPLIRTGGVIACHDYNHPYFPELTTAIDEFASKHNAKVNICPLHMIYIDKTW